jgi:hypothetical protein
MFDEALQKAEQAITRMSKALTVFEKESEILKVKLSEDLKVLQVITEQKIRENRDQVEKIYADYSKGMEVFYVDCKNKLSVLITADLEYFSQEVKKRFENLYLNYEEEAKKKITQLFETDIQAVFTKHGDVLIPLIFKSFFRYIFSIICKFFKSFIRYILFRKE